MSIGSVIIAAQQFSEFGSVWFTDREFLVIHHNDSRFQVDLLNGILPDDKSAVNLKELIGRQFIQNFLNSHPDHEGFVTDGDYFAVVFLRLGEQYFGVRYFVKNLVFSDKEEILVGTA